LSLHSCRGLHVNPWTHFPRLITSVDFIKRERPLIPLCKSCRRKPAFPPKPDLLIIDEAHNMALSGRNRLAIDFLRTQAIRTLVPPSEHELLDLSRLDGPTA